MFVPPEPPNLRYVKAEAEYRRGQMQGRGGSLILELIKLLWLGVKGIVWLVILPIRLSLSWRQKRKRKKTQDPFDWLNETREV